MTKSDTPLAAVHSYVDAFNRGDGDGMAACFVAQGSILDGMAPHLWFGPNAASDWYRDVLAEGEHLDAGDYHATLGDPIHDNITGESAYLVVPASMTFRFKDRQITQTGASFTFALTKQDDIWRIAAWSWAKGKAQG
jgi:hypothetical protein